MDTPNNATEGTPKFLHPSYTDDDGLGAASIDKNDFDVPIIEFITNTEEESKNDTPINALHNVPKFITPITKTNDNTMDTNENNPVGGAPKFIVPSTNSEQSHNNYVPINSSVPLQNKDTNYIFFFGKAQQGKSALLATLLYYMNSQAGTISPHPKNKNTQKATALLFDFLDNIRRGKLPTRTEQQEVIEINLVFKPNNKSKKVKPINLTFLEISGDDLVKVRRGGTMDNTIEEFLNANIPLTFILVTDYASAQDDDSLMISFLHHLQSKKNNYNNINAVLVIAKWDTKDRFENIGQENKYNFNDSLKPTANELEEFCINNMPMTNNQVNNYELARTYYTVGNFKQNDDGTEDLLKIDQRSAEILTKWLYKNITGIPMDTPGTFCERLWK